jgi:hypothetical protein
MRTPFVQRALLRHNLLGAQLRTIVYPYLFSLFFILPCHAHRFYYLQRTIPSVASLESRRRD